MDPSGIRVGTPGPATLGMDEPEMKEVVEHHRRRRSGTRATTEVEAASRARVAELMGRFPAYAG